jgi:predicted  nucleic acid-binding Zn-ribbon protein
MSSNAIDCSSIEQRIDEYNLYISTTQDQVNKLDPDDPDIQNKRDALTRKLDNLHEQQGLLQRALEDCRQGKGANFPTFDIVSEDGAV